MRTEFPRSTLKGLAVPSGGLPPLPGGASGGALPQLPAGGPAGAPLGGFAMPQVPPTPAEQLIAGLAPPSPGVVFPGPALGPDAPTSSADPRDLQGTWYHNQKLETRIQRDMYGELAPYNMEGAKVLARRVKSKDAGKPFVNASAICRPPGPLWQRDLNMPFQIFQSNDAVEFVFEEYHGRWRVALDMAKAPPPAQKDYMGYSVGHWDGATLVVETSDFKQALWLDVDGTPLSANGKLIQRIRKVDNGDSKPFLEVITTIDDPTYYTRPWSVVRTFVWNPRMTYFDEYNCEEQVGDPSTDPDAGLVPEPKD